MSRWLATKVLRHEGLLWGALLSVLACSIAALPRLELAFGFREVLGVHHPARRDYDRFEKHFGLGDTLIFYFHGPRVFSGPFLEDLGDLRGSILRIDGIESVVSPLDILIPETRDGHMRLRRVLDDETLTDPPRLTQVLHSPPFSRQWVGYLYDEKKTILTLIVRPAREFDDPWKTLGLVERVEAEVEAFTATHGVNYHENGLFYLNAEMIRATFRDQGRMTGAALTVLTLLFWALFGRFVLALSIMVLLVLSSLPGYALMAIGGIPINGLSGNLPVMVLVIGVTDAVHIVGRFLAAREKSSRQRSAALAFEETFIPNLLTSLTTFGCLLVMGWTELAVLETFAHALCIGVTVVFVTTMIYVPLILRRLAPEDPHRGLYPRLHSLFTGRMVRPWLATAAHPLVPLGFLAFLVPAGYATAQQRLNSNWYQYFVQGHRVDRMQEFLKEEGFMIASVDVTLPVGGRLDEVVEDRSVLEALETLEASLRKHPKVLDVYSLLDLRELIEDRWPGLGFEDTLAPVWARARKQALYRLYQQLGAFDEYYAPSDRRARLVVATQVEDSAGLIALGEDIARQAAALPAEMWPVSKGIVLTGRTILWGSIMDYIGETFSVSLAGSLLFVFLVFLALTRRLTLAVLAMVPNVIPLITMFGTAHWMGYELSENFCFLVSLTIGIAVDDTIHFLYHYTRLLESTRDVQASLEGAFRAVGTQVVATSVLLVAGFAACVTSEIVPMILTGVFMSISIGTALVCDLLVMPALLLRTGTPRRPS